MRKLTAGILSIALVACFAVAPVVHAQEDLRLRQLENEVLRLQREIDAQNMRIEGLERSARLPGGGSSPPVVVSPRAADSSPSWLISANWDKVHTGMKELDVIALLGRPTSVHTDEDGKTHVMFYAMELGPNTFLTGNVRVGDAGVTQITRPA